MQTRKWKQALLVLPFSLGSLFADEVRLNNQGIEAYAQGDYEQAMEYLSQAEQECGERAEYCDQVHYNLGNTLYRLGEGEESVEERKRLWQQAVGEYEESLGIKPEDEQAIDNLEFVREKLQDLEKQQAQDSGDSNQQSGNSESEGNQSESQDGEAGEQEGESESGGETQRQQQSEGEQGSSGSTNQENQQEGESESDSQRQLSEELNRQLEEYMQEQEQQARELGEYLNRNPQAQDDFQDPFESMFNDPFLEQFFGGNPFFERQFGQLPNENERDW